MSETDAKMSAVDIKTSAVKTIMSAVNTKLSTVNTQTSAFDTKTSAVDMNSSAVNTQTSAVNTHSSSVNIQTSAVSTHTSAVSTQTSSVNTQTSAVNTLRPVADVNEETFQQMRGTMASSLERIQVLEEQIKTIPILQMRLSALKEEKRLLNQQLKTSKNTIPNTSTMEIGDDNFYTTEKDQHQIPPVSNIQPTTTTKSGKNPPPTLPKPDKKYSIGVNDHSVLESYKNQPDLPTEYIVRENETAFDKFSKKSVEEKMFSDNKNQADFWNSSLQQQMTISRPFSSDLSADNTRERRSDTNQQMFPVSKFLKSTAKPSTRTIGIGDGSINDDPNSEKELKAVITGQKDVLAWRNIGTECRPATRDVGVMFVGKEVKPETRTVGVNVTFDSTSVMASLDFQAEEALPVAQQDVLQRNGQIMGADYRLKPASSTTSTMADFEDDVNVVSDGMENKVEDEVRLAAVRKSLSVIAESELIPKYIKTDDDRTYDGFPNICQGDVHHKAIITNQEKQEFVFTNTKQNHPHRFSNQTEQQDHTSIDKTKHAGSINELITHCSTGSSKDVSSSRNASINKENQASPVIEHFQYQQMCAKSIDIGFIHGLLETENKMESDPSVTDVVDDQDDYCSRLSQEQHMASLADNGYINDNCNSSYEIITTSTKKKDIASARSFGESSDDFEGNERVPVNQHGELISLDLPDNQLVQGNHELTQEVKDACLVQANYLIDSTSIKSKELNASQNILKDEWFKLSSQKFSNPHRVKDFMTMMREISERLLEYVVNVTDSNGNTAIHYCISHCNFEIVSLLLESGVCDANKRNKGGYTPVMLAGLTSIQGQSQMEVIRRLLSLGDYNARAASTQQTALMLAASHGQAEMVRMLVEVGADINLQDEDGSTALMCACEHGHQEVVNFLLSQPSTDIYITDNDNSTAFSVAMEAGHKDIGVILYKRLNFYKATQPNTFCGIAHNSLTYETKHSKCMSNLEKNKTEKSP